MDELPTVSIIIPAYNAEATIVNCLDSICFLDYPKSKLEVVVVDNGSTDRTAEYAQRENVQLVSMPEGNVGAVRNFGSKFASGQVLAHTDSDCILPPNWLKDAVKILIEEPDVGAVGGGCLVPDDATMLEKAWVVVQKEDVKKVRCLPACNFILWKSIFTEIGGFNEVITAGEDDDLSVNVTNAGYRLMSLKACYVVHLGYPKTYSAIYKRQVWHGESALSLYPTTAKMLFATLFFFISLLSCLGLLLFGVKGVWLWCCALSATLFMPAVMVFKRIRSNHIAFFQSIVLLSMFVVFFLGRVVGMLSALVDEAATRRKSPRKSFRQ